MAGKYTNLFYDSDASNERVWRSTDPMQYRLDPSFANNCTPCHAPYGPSGSDNNYRVADIVDIDSVLRGVDRTSSKGLRHQVPKSLEGFEQSRNTGLPSCNDRFESEYTRYTHPSFDIKGLGAEDMRLDYPLHDPQCQVFEDFRVNTRLQAKDDHKAVWQMPMDQTSALPRERRPRTKNCTVTIDCGYAPF